MSRRPDFFRNPYDPKLEQNKDALWKLCEDKGIKRGNISPEEETLITHDDLCQVIEVHNKNPKLTIKDILF